MKNNTILVIAFTLTIFHSFAQKDSKQNQGRKILIEFNSPASFHEVNLQYNIVDEIVYHSNSGFRIYPDYDTITRNNEVYIVFQYPSFGGSKQYNPEKGLEGIRIIDLPIHVDMIQENESGVTEYVNHKRMAMKKSDFDEIAKIDHYNNRFWSKGSKSISSGILTVPFKLRPSIDSTNFNITTDITLGPYIGLSQRLSPTKRYFATLAGTAGLSFININNNNTSNKDSESEIGVIPGVTWSLGLIVQLEDFNLGVVLGQDYASGVGSDWRYHGKTWFSFSIGYNFLKNQ